MEEIQGADRRRFDSQGNPNPDYMPPKPEEISATVKAESESTTESLRRQQEMIEIIKINRQVELMLAEAQNKLVISLTREKALYWSLTPQERSEVNNRLGIGNVSQTKPVGFNPIQPQSGGGRSLDKIGFEPENKSK